MGTSKKRKNHKAKIDNRRQLDKMARRRYEKDLKEHADKQRAILTDKYSQLAANNLPVDPVTKQIMSPRDAMIAGLADNFKNNNGNSSSSLLSENIYWQK